MDSNKSLNLKPSLINDVLETMKVPFELSTRGGEMKVPNYS
jgi:hypothetical protein